MIFFNNKKMITIEALCIYNDQIYIHRMNYEGNDERFLVFTNTYIIKMVLDDFIYKNNIKDDYIILMRFNLEFDHKTIKCTSKNIEPLFMYNSTPITINNTLCVYDHEEELEIKSNIVILHIEPVFILKANLNLLNNLPSNIKVISFFGHNSLLNKSVSFPIFLEKIYIGKKNFILEDYFQFKIPFGSNIYFF